MNNVGTPYCNVRVAPISLYDSSVGYQRKIPMMCGWYRTTPSVNGSMDLYITRGSIIGLRNDGPWLLYRSTTV